MRLTRSGIQTLVASVVALVAGFVTGVPVLIAAGVAGLVVLASALRLVMEAPSVAVDRRAEPTEVQRGETGSIRLGFASRGGRPQRSFLALEHVDGDRRAVIVPRIAGGCREEIGYAVDTRRRGVVIAGPVDVERADPFGLVRAGRRIEGDCAISVRPRVLPLENLPAGLRRDLDGPTRERSEGSNSFHQLREYVIGDDLRYVHWRSSARTGTLVVRQMVDTTRPELVVVLDNRAVGYTDSGFEDAVDAAASVMSLAERVGFPSRLLITRIEGEPEGFEHQAAIDRLTAVSAVDRRSLVDVGNGISGRGRSMVFITGALSARDLRQVTRMGRGFSPAIIVSFHPAEVAPVVAPPGFSVINCADSGAFAAEWRNL